MRFFTPRISGPGFAAAVGAGLAAALCLMLPAQKLALGGVKVGAAHPLPFGTLAAIAMGMLAPLPLMIASLGFGSIAGIIAVAVGGVTIAVIGLVPDAQALLQIDTVSPTDIAAFVLVVGAPSWLMSRLIAAPVGGAEADKAARLVRREERLLGTILAVAIGFGVISAWLILSTWLTASGGLDAFVGSLAAEIKTAAAARPDMPKGMDPHKMALSALYLITSALAIGPELMLLFNLWFAARIAQMSGLLSTPWPDVARHLRLPRPLALIFAVSLGLSFAGGVAGLFSLAMSGAIAAGLLMQGLAVLHAVTRDKTWRTPTLVIVYLLLPWLAVFCGLLGLLDMAFAFRDRQKPPAPPAGPWRRPPTTTPKR